jgi:uncharacterized repeat protein (TIGR02543 family)
MKRFISVISVFLFFLVLVSFTVLNAQWARTYGGSYLDYAYSVQQTADGGYIVAGGTESFGGGLEDILILKLNSYGEIEWQKSYGGRTYDLFYSLQQTSDGGYIVAGITESASYTYSLWVLKLTPTGDIKWQKNYTTSDYSGVYSCFARQTSDSGYIISAESYTEPLGMGSWILKLNSAGGIKWQKFYDAQIYSIEQTSDGGFIAAGVYRSDMCVLKLSSVGIIEWQYAYGGGYYDSDSGVQQTSDGGYILFGYTQSFGMGGADLWVLKLNSTGGIEWQKAYGGRLNEYSWNPSSLGQTHDGYILAGMTYSFGTGQRDGFILKLSLTGAIQWQKSYGGVEMDSIQSVQQTTDGGYIMGGSTESFGAGDFDSWLLKCSPDGEIATSCGFIGISDAKITDTAVSPVAISVKSQSINLVVSDTSIMPQDSYVIADLLCELRYTLIVGAATGGTTNPVPGTYTYPGMYSGQGITSVSVTAVPDNGYRFDSWSGNVPSGHEKDSPITITMDSDKSVSASFIRQYKLTIAAGIGGTTDPVSGTYTYDSGTQVSIAAIPNTGYRFSGWSGDATGTTNPIAVTMDSNKSIAANFIRQYTLTIATGTGGTTDPVPGTYIYDLGTEVSVKATPNTGYRFDKWTGDITGTTNPITITMDGNKSISAGFTRQYKLTIATGSGGTTDPAPGTYTYDSGAQVSVKAMPNSGYQFSGWSGSVSGTTNPITITMDADKSVTASFTEIPKPPEKKKGGCFIATAAYGSPLDPHVQVLRDFRDKYLMTNKPGQAFVRFYYKYSPPIANFIERHKVLKSCVRILLIPLITVSYLTV